MKEIKFFMNEYMFIANCLLFLCYLQTNLLMFRLLFAGACLFIVLSALSMPIIIVDNVIFNILFTFINLYYASNLISNLAPPKFTTEQKDIFKNHFKNYLTPIEFNFLLSAHRRKIIRVSTPIIKKGNEFSSLIFVAKIGKSARIRMKTNKRVFDLEEYSWVGIPEYLHILSKKDSLHKAVKEYDTGEWGLNMNVEMEEEYKHGDTQGIQESVDLFADSKDFSRIEDENIVVLYEFELSNLDKVCSDHNYGTNIIRGLHSIWLRFCSNIVKRFNEINATSTSKMTGNTSTSFTNKAQVSFSKTLKKSVTMTSYKPPQLSDSKMEGLETFHLKRNMDSSNLCENYMQKLIQKLINSVLGSTAQVMLNTNAPATDSGYDLGRIQPTLTSPFTNESSLSTCFYTILIVIGLMLLLMKFKENGNSFSTSRLSNSRPTGTT